jgi:hypothetical protein
LLEDSRAAAEIYRVSPSTLLADTKLAEDFVQQVLAVAEPDDLTQPFHRLAQVESNELT